MLENRLRAVCFSEWVGRISESVSCLKKCVNHNKKFYIDSFV